MGVKALSIVVLVIFLCSALTFIPLASAQGLTASIRIPSIELYAPCRVTVQFAYTKDVTVTTTTLGASLYRVVTEPIQATFSTEAFDVYTITIRIPYEGVVNQTITIGIFEGGRAAKGLEWDVNAKTVIIEMKLTVVEAPSFPTVDEFIEPLWTRWANELHSFQIQQNELFNKMTETVTIIGSLAAIAFVMTVVILAAMFYIHRKVSELSAWGIRHEMEARKGVQEKD